MWFILTKKQIREELRKAQEKVEESLKKRDTKIENLKDKLENNSLKIATLEGAYTVLSQKSHNSSTSVPVPKSGTKSGTGFETKMMKIIKKSKRSIIISEILKLIDLYSVNEVFNIIVNERNLCPKTYFYRYYNSIKSQHLINN